MPNLNYLGSWPRIMACEVDIGLPFPSRKGAKGVGLIALCHEIFVYKDLNKGFRTHVAPTLKDECAPN